MVHSEISKSSREPEVRTCQRSLMCLLGLEGLEGMRQGSSINTACVTEQRAVELFLLLTATTATSATISPIANLVCIQHMSQSNLHFLSLSHGLDVALDGGSKCTGRGKIFPAFRTQRSGNKYLSNRPLLCHRSTRTGLVSRPLSPLHLSLPFFLHTKSQALFLVLGVQQCTKEGHVCPSRHTF